MYFHLIWIKEKNWAQYEIDCLIQWGDETFLRDFLLHRGVVIVNITKFEWDSASFGNILLTTTYKKAKIEILTQWDDLEERIYFFIFLDFAPETANFVDKPISDDESKALIESTIQKIKQENENIKQQKQEEEIKEQKIYEEKWTKEWLKAINSNITRIEQVMKVWQWIISWTEMKELEDYLNELKKIQFWTNFNKMAALVLDVHSLLLKAEKEIFDAHNDNKFLIDKNSSVTNMDIISENYTTNRIKEKYLFQPQWLTTRESFDNMVWPSATFIKLLEKDIIYTFQSASKEEFFDVTMNIIEYITLSWTVVATLTWLIWGMFQNSKFSLYILPALWWLGILIYLYNNLKLKSWPAKLVWFVVMAFLYWRWLIMLLNTFAL